MKNRKIEKIKNNIKKKIDKKKKEIKEEVEEKLTKRSVITFAISFFAIITIIFLIILYNFSRLEAEIAGLVAGYGYIAIFVTAFLVDIIMQPIGPEIPLIAGAVTGMRLPYVVLFTIIGSALASVTGYWLGKTYGARGFKKLYNKATYMKWKERYGRKGIFILAIAAISPVPYVPVCWLSGMFHMKRSNFFLYGILTRIIRILTVSFVIMLVKGI